MIDLCVAGKRTQDFVHAGEAFLQQSYTPSPRRLLFIVIFIVSLHCCVNSRRVTWQLRAGMSFKSFLLVGC